METCGACGVRMLRSSSGRCPSCGDLPGEDVEGLVAGSESGEGGEAPILSERPLFLTVRQAPTFPRYCACCGETDGLTSVELRAGRVRTLSAWSCEECASHVRGGPELGLLYKVLWVLLVPLAAYTYVERSWLVVVALAIIGALIWVDYRRHKAPTPRPIGPGHAGAVALRWIVDAGSISSCNASLIEDLRLRTAGSREQEQLVLRALHAGVEVFFNPYVPEQVAALLQSFRAGVIAIEREGEGDLFYAELDAETQARFTFEHIDAAMKRQQAETRPGGRRRSHQPLGPQK